METETHFGSYRILRKVGGGGMADVYEAVRVGLDNFQTRVALKCILPSLTRDRRFVKMFIKEAHLGSQLQHPNIIQIQDFNKVNDTYYIAMEFVDGVDLSRVIKRLRAKGISFPASVVIELGLEVLAGLGYAHQARRADGTPLNIIHRDVKPSNILITPAGSVKIGDFGIAKATDSTTSHSLTGEQLKGTIHYMSPEQIDGVPLTPASDLFCLGSILFEMLTLRPLFIGPTMSAVLLKIVMVNIEPDLQIIINNYPEFEGMLRKALAPDPADRYSRASEMGEALHGIAEGLEGGVSLKQFLAIHPELFEPFGTQPGDGEDDADMLSIVRSPQSLADSSVEVAVPPYRDNLQPNETYEPERSEAEVEIVDPDGDMENWTEQPDPGLAYEYYPPIGPPEQEASQPVAALPDDDEIGEERQLAGIAQDLLGAPAAGVDAGTGIRATPGDPPAAPVSLLHADPVPDAGKGLGTDNLGLASPAETGRGIEQEASGRDVSAPRAGVAETESSWMAGASDPMPAPHHASSRHRPAWPYILMAVGGGALVAVFLFFMARAPERPSATHAGGDTQPGATAAPSAAIPSPVVPSPAQIHIDSKPRGARISLGGDGQSGALTPTTLPLPLDANQVTVRLELDGYEPFVQTITYVAGQKLSLEPTLVPVPSRGTLEVVSSPSGAEIFLDGEKTGHATPYVFKDLDLGKPYRVALALPGYVTWKEAVTFTNRTTVKIDATLTRRVAPPKVTRSRTPPAAAAAKPPVPGKATIVLNTTPPDAEVFVDGVSRGPVPATIEVRAGEHRIEFKMVEDGKTKSTTVILKPGETRRVVWDVVSNRWLAP